VVRAAAFSCLQPAVFPIRPDPGFDAADGDGIQRLALSEIRCLRFKLLLFRLALPQDRWALLRGLL